MKRAWFEIYESGDPYASTYDATEYADDPRKPEVTTGVYRGDLSGLWGRSTLIAKIRAAHPGCVIVSRYSNRVVRA